MPVPVVEFDNLCKMDTDNTDEDVCFGEEGQHEDKRSPDMREKHASK